MSDREHISYLNSSFKRARENYVGHDMPLLAEYSGNAMVYGSYFPRNGPLLFVLENRQRPDYTGTFNFTYKKAIQSGLTSDTVLNQTIYYKTYLEDSGIYSGTVTFDSGARNGSQILFTGSYNIYQLNSLTATDDLSEVSVYALSSPGSKLMHGVNKEDILDTIDTVSRSWWLSSPPCQLCDKTGLYNGSTCPDCAGRGYIGFYAQDWFLEQRLFETDTDIHSDETENTKVLRGWSKKWWIAPTRDEIQRYIAFFTNIDSGFVEIYEYNDVEVYYDVFIPNFITDSTASGLDFNLDAEFLEEILDHVTPAGMSAIPRPYNGIIGEYVEEYTGEWIHDFEDTDGGLDDFWPIDFIGGSGTWSEAGAVAPESRYSGTWVSGIWSGAYESGYIYEGFTATGNEDFYTGIDYDTYNEIIDYDNFWGYSGEVLYV